MDTCGVELDTFRKSQCSVINQLHHPRLFLIYVKSGGPCVECNNEINYMQVELKCRQSYRTHPFRVPEFTVDADWDDK
jgi:hypothetical protein